MSAVPYCGPAPPPEGLLAAWNLDPALLAALMLAAFALRREGPAAKAGLAVLALAYVSPLCALSAGLFSARALHHLVIVFVAAPLLAGVLRGARMRLVPAFLAHVAVFWLWHLPSAYEVALSSDLAYWAGQIALLGSALALWRALGEPETPLPAAFFAIAAMVMQMGMLGAVLTFAPAALYAPHYLTTAQYGIGVLADQQLAGIAMWIGNLPLTFAAAAPALLRLLRQARQAVAA